MVELHELHLLAVKVSLRNVINSCAERSWSTYIYSHNVKGNRVDANHAEKLVYVHYNIDYYQDKERTTRKKIKNCDAHPNDDNLEDDMLSLEELDNMDDVDEDDL